MPFRDRAEAGRRLARLLGAHQGEDLVVLALPRGGLPVARAISDALGVPLDVLVARKIGAPGNPEFAIGAVTAGGHRVLNQTVLRRLMIPPGYIEAKARDEQQAANERAAFLRGDRPESDLRGKVVILVDDGVATGMTMKAAIEEVRARSPARIVVAAPVVAPDTLLDLERLADEVVALEVPSLFFAVGQFYEDFRQVTDEEAKACLAVGAP